MALIYVGETIPVLTLERELFDDKYWNQGLSPFIAGKYGYSTISDHKEVDLVLMDCFEYFVDKFETLVQQQDTEMFFRCVFYLHEASVRLYRIYLDNDFQFPAFANIEAIHLADFFIYRRVLKLILEQACDIELTAKKCVARTEFFDIIQELHYIGYQCYDFAIKVANHKMTPTIFYTEFDNGIFKHCCHIHFEKIIQSLYGEFDKAFEAFFDQSASKELVKAIEDSFSIDFNQAVGVIAYVKHYFSDEPDQTIEPYVLPINLANECGTSIQLAETFYSGLTISKKNKLSIKDAILKPHLGNRFLYRPLLTFIVDGVERAFCARHKFYESINAIANNGVHWGAVPEEWLKNKGIRKFVNQKEAVHDQLLEDEIERIFIGSGCPYRRNVKSFKQKGKNNVNIERLPAVGEFDFIIVNANRRKVFIAETKYCRARYDSVAFQTDYTNFIDKHESQLSNKENWLQANLQILQEDLELTFQINYSILDFDVEAVFFLNTPTFYMFDGKYKAVTLNRIKDFIEGSWDFPEITINDDENNRIFTYSHPYFSKPPVITRQG
jgi:hypothetical protein